MSDQGFLKKRFREKNPLDNCVTELLFALTTDQAQHKQYHIERAFRAICEDSYVDKAKKTFVWPEGVEP